MRPMTRIVCNTLLLFGLLSYGHAGAAEKNVLFIITDDESPTLGCYGDPIAVTPAIDAIARDGMIFRNAFATTASCMQVEAWS